MLSIKWKKRMLFSMVSLMLVFFALLNPAIADEAKILTMATTTSTDNTGLLDELSPKFKKDTGIELRWTATGTGKALKLGENCDVDILMVHAPESEQKFVADGFGTERREVMYNDFVIVGPTDDPAGIKGMSIKDAFEILISKQIAFVSRGDNSGTHKKELSLWKAAEIGIPEKEKWYVQTGQGMLATINIAAEKKGYTMTDRGTYIKYEHNMNGNPPLKIMVEGDIELLNQYSVIAVNPKRCAKVKRDLATEFIKWITAEAAQNEIKEFKLLGKQLFIPNAK